LLRNFYTASSCGVCGKASLEAVKRQVPARERPAFRVQTSALLELPAALAGVQPEFTLTGGLHAAASFDEAGNLRCVREDIGRHNALDKLVGSYPEGLDHLGVLLSGRSSFELNFRPE